MGTREQRELWGILVLASVPFLVAFLWLPSVHYPQLANALGIEPNRWADLSIQLCALIPPLAVLPYWLKHRERSALATSAVESSAGATGPQLWTAVRGIQLVISLVVGYRLWASVGRPFDFDEHVQIMSCLTHGPIPDRETFSSALNHFLPQALSGAAMHWLGVSKLSVRLPSLLCAVALLLILWKLASRYFGPFTVSLLYLQLVANELVFHFLGSARGYAAAILFGTLSVFFFVHASREELRSYRWASLILIFLGLAVALSHNFAGLLFVLLSVSWLVWLALSARTLSRCRIDGGLRLLVPLLYLLPLLVCCGLRLVSGLQRDSRAFLSATPGTISRLMMYPRALGYASIWQAKIAALLILALVAASVLRRRFRSPSFLSVFWMVSCVFVPWLASALAVGALQPRFFLPFVIPLVLWVGSQIESIPERVPRRVAMALALLILAILPRWHASRVVDRGEEMPLGGTEYETFLTRVAEQVRRRGKPCVQFAGDYFEAAWAKAIYLEPLLDPRSPPEQCLPRFLVYFPQRSFLDRKLSWHPELFPGARLVLRQGGYELYETGVTLSQFSSCHRQGCLPSFEEKTTPDRFHQAPHEASRSHRHLSSTSPTEEVLRVGGGGTAVGRRGIDSGQRE